MLPPARRAVTKRVEQSRSTQQEMYERIMNELEKDAAAAPDADDGINTTAVQAALVVSSRHLDEGGLDFAIGCGAASPDEEGIVAFRLRATAEDDLGPDMPPCLANLLLAAREKGCAFLIVDTFRGGAVLPWLPVYKREGGA
jgi:hypothetical protein